MRSNTGSSANWFAGSPPVTAAPFTVAGWVNLTSTATIQDAWYLGDAGGSNYWVIYLNTNNGSSVSAGRVDVEISAGGGTIEISPTPTLSVGTPGHVAFVEALSNDHRVYINGGNVATNNTTKTPTAGSITQVNLGAFRASGGTFGPINAALGYWCMWNVALTDAEIAALAAGVTPWRIRPASLVAFWPMFGAATGNAPDMHPQGLSGTQHLLTQNGTMGATSDPPIRKFWPSYVSVFDLGSGGGGIGGAASITLGGCTISSAGTLLIQAAESTTLGAVSLNGTGTIHLQAAESTTLANCSILSIGALLVQAGSAVSIGPVSLFAAGSLTLQSAASIDLDSCTITSAGSLAIAGTLGIALDAATLTSAGLLAIQAAASLTLDSCTLVSTGTPVGIAAITLGPATLTSAGDLVIQAAATVGLDTATLASTGRLFVQAAVSVELAPVSLTSVGQLVVQGLATVLLGDATLVSDGTLTSIGIGGNATIQLAPAMLAAAGALLIQAVASVLLEPVTLISAGDLPSPPIGPGDWSPSPTSPGTWSQSPNQGPGWSVTPSGAGSW